MWCDSARPHPQTGRRSLLGYRPWWTLQARGRSLEARTRSGLRRWRQHPLEALRQGLARYGNAKALRGLPWADGLGVMGFVSYEMNRWIERLPERPADRRPAADGSSPAAASWPDMRWHGMGIVLVVDHLRQETWLVGVADPHAPRPAARRSALRALDEAEALLDGASASVLEPWSLRAGTGVSGRIPLEATTSQPAFEAGVHRILEHIRAGDIYQANLSQRFTMPWDGDARRLYSVLREVNPSPFACFLTSDDLAVVSCSPERLVQVQDGGRISTRPIAGTRPRGFTPLEDAVNGLGLLMSEKERAEHLMLVDLARNDLGRLCAAGSVAVRELMALEEYSHVIHIVSDISGLLRADCGAVEVLRAMFPGGTITGCPKVRCMEIVQALEPVARGLYTGSLGVLGFNGTMDLNIAIRTMAIQGGRLSMHVGAGIVADSEPAREYQETLAKAAALFKALEGAAAHEPAGRAPLATSSGSPGRTHDSR